MVFILFSCTFWIELFLLFYAKIEQIVEASEK
jgi:hypothetical protein